METNYYLHEEVCPHCERGASDPRHIGKSSVGWCFALKIYPEERINSLDDWRKIWIKPDALIRNEYGDTVSPKEMFAIITERGHRDTGFQTSPIGYKGWGDFHRKNHSAFGPNGMLRHQIDGAALLWPWSGDLGSYARGVFVSDLVVCPYDLRPNQPKWCLQLRRTGMPETEYITLATGDESWAREIVDSGTPFWLFGEPHK